MLNSYKKDQRKFVEPTAISKHLSCPICREIFDDPIRITCGHTFCHECLDKYEDDAGYIPPCPICRTNYIQIYSGKDLIAQSIINDSYVFCINDCCPWKGKLGDLNDHLKNCIFNSKKLPEFIKKDIEENKKNNENNNKFDCEKEEIDEEINKNTSFNYKSSIKERVYCKNPGLLNKVFDEKEKNEIGTEKISDDKEINDLYNYLSCDREKKEKKEDVKKKKSKKQKTSSKEKKLNESSSVYYNDKLNKTFVSDNKENSLMNLYNNKLLKKKTKRKDIL